MSNLKATLKLEEKMRFDGKAAGSGHHVKLDTDVENKGFRPLELFLIGMAGCSAMDMINILYRQRQKVTDFTVEAEVVERAPEDPMVFTKVEVVFHITGRDIDEKAVQRALDLTETKYCSGMAMVRESAELITRYEIHPA
jgi:putative redox protein